MTEMPESYNNASYSRQKNMERELKILAFEDAIQRQGRSLKKLLNGHVEDVIGTRYAHTAQMKEESRESYQFERLPVIRELIFQAPLIKPEKSSQVVDNIHLNYLQSDKYHRYLEQILKNTKSGNDIVHKIQSIRANYKQLETIPCKLDSKVQSSIKIPNLNGKKERQNSQCAINLFKNPNKAVFDRDLQLNCQPYLEKSSIFLKTQSEVSEQQIRYSQNLDTHFNYQQEHRRATYLRNVRQQESNHKISQDLSNVKTLLKRQPYLCSQLKKGTVFTMSHKPNLNQCPQAVRKGARSGGEQVCINNRHKTNANKENQSLPKQKQTYHFSKSAIKEKEQFQPSKNKKSNHTIKHSPIKEQKTPNKVCHSSSLYSIDFKLNRPSQSRQLTHTTSAINLLYQRSISHSKSLSKIKLSVVTLSQKHNR